MSSSYVKMMKQFSKYESEISSVLGMLVVAAFAIFLFLVVKKLVPKPSISPNAETESAEDLMKTGGKRTYTVASGQGLSQIAKEVYGDGSKWMAIARANDIKAPYTIEKGQVLTIPEDDELATIEKATAAPEAKEVISAEEKTSKVAVEPVTTSQGGKYVVQKGDNLWKIAVTQMNDGYSWVKLYQANKQLIGKNPGIILPGMELVIPE